MTQKIATYLGFCIRSGKIVYGVDDAEKQKRGIQLILVDGTLSENSLKQMQKVREKFNCPILKTEENLLGELLHKPAVKAVSIKDKNLASAIFSAAEGNSKFKSISGGND